MKSQKYLIIGFILGAISFGGICFATSMDIKVDFLPLKYFFNDLEAQTRNNEQGFIYNGRTYVPLRFISEALNKDVIWNEKKLSISVNDKSKQNEVEEISKIKFGNTEGNIMNQGLVAKQGDWIYYTSSDNWKLYKMRTDGLERTLITEGATLDIMVVGDWIYYSNGKGNYSSYKIKIDGTEKQKISEESSFLTYGDQNWLIFYDNGWWRERLDGSFKQRIFSEIAGKSPFCFKDKWMYFFDENEIVKKINFYDLSEIYTLGEFKPKETPSIEKGMCYDKYFYYYMFWDYGRLCRINLDKFAIEKLDCLDKVNDFNISDGWIYYSSYSDKSKLYKSKLDGTKKTKLSDIETMSINIVDDWIYFRDKTNTEGRIYKIKKDGTGQTIVE